VRVLVKASIQAMASSDDDSRPLLDSEDEVQSPPTLRLRPSTARGARTASARGPAGDAGVAFRPVLNDPRTSQANKPAFTPEQVRPDHEKAGSLDEFSPQFQRRREKNSSSGSFPSPVPWSSLALALFLAVCGIASFSMLASDLWRGYEHEAEEKEAFLAQWDGKGQEVQAVHTAFVLAEAIDTNASSRSSPLFTLEASGFGHSSCWAWWPPFPASTSAPWPCWPSWACRDTLWTTFLSEKCALLN